MKKKWCFALIYVLLFSGCMPWVRYKEVNFLPKMPIKVELEGNPEFNHNGYYYRDRVGEYSESQREPWKELAQSYYLHY